MDTKQLPIVKVPFSRLDPNWVGEYIDGKCVNMELRYLPKRMEDAEVLTLNLNAGTMRVRMVQKDKFGTFDTDITYFFNSHSIEKI